MYGIVDKPPGCVFHMSCVLTFFSETGRSTSLRPSSEARFLPGAFRDYTHIEERGEDTLETRSQVSKNRATLWSLTVATSCAWNS